MPSLTRIDLHAAARAGSVALLTDFSAAANIGLQIYPGRPAAIYPPCGFVDTLDEEIAYTGLNQRTIRPELVVLHGVYDHKDTVAQRDAFVDAFVDWSLDNVHEMHANTTLVVVSIADDPTYVPDWLRPELQRTYYGTRITLEGLALTG